MKKTLIALGVAAGAIAAAQAQNTTNLYSSLGYSIKVVEGQALNEDDSTKNKIKDVKKQIGDNIWNLSTTTAKFGIKSTEDLSNGLQAFMKFQFGVNDSAGVNKTSLAYLGLKGDFGTLTLGKQDSIWKMALTYNDIFHDLGPFSTANVKGDNMGHAGPGGIQKAITYVSPDYSGFVLGASIVIDGDNKASDNVDAYEIGAMYDNMGWYAAVAYNKTDELVAVNKNAPATKKTSTESVGANLGYSNDQFKVGLGYEHKSRTADFGNFGFEYYNGANTFRAGVGYKAHANKADEFADSMNYALGYQYNFSERTYTWVEAEFNDYTENKQQDKLDGYTALVGIRHDF